MGRSNNQGPWGGGGNIGGGGGKRPTGGKNNQPDLDELLKKSQESLKNVFGGGGKNGGGGDNSILKPAILISLGILIIWSMSGIYRVEADEQGVVLRFGKFHHITEPGLNYHLPSPIETAYTPRITTINKEEVGFRSVGASRYSNKSSIKSIPEESYMLTGDKNIVSTQFEVQWRIKDAVQYMFNLRGPEHIVKPVAETAMREIIGNNTLSMALSGKRQFMGERAKILMQEIMDKYETGIDIYEVNLLAVDAPEPVVDAFIDVLAAQQEKETLQNNAKKYRDGIIPVAQGQAGKLIKDAEGYKQEVVAKAEGEAARFSSVYNEYKLAKNVTRKRMYYETMEGIMSGMNKVILSNEAGNAALPYLALPSIKNKK